MTNALRAELDLNSEYMLRVNGSKTHVAGLLLYTTLLWLLKDAGEGVHKMYKIIQWAYVILPATYIACLLVVSFKCIPFHHQWQINPFPGSKLHVVFWCQPRKVIDQPSPNSCGPSISTLQTIFAMVMNTLTDFYLLAIPAPMRWFSGDYIGILRAASILTLGDIGPAQSSYWSIRELFVSVVLTNMPMVYPLFRICLETGLNIFRGGTKLTTVLVQQQQHQQSEGPRRFSLRPTPPTTDALIASFDMLNPSRRR
ncbi:hypothetical protein B0H63DRAFT_520386 [Podospora didyma]|uniref:Integral membrane protein n=1 Tax=Podospora didyma TaxID=330526 RepID=A0AAE0U545_9PEZI|nr:hypothetical protein B0H63DRAFT_520386 [Podospora didyma]